MDEHSQNGQHVKVFTRTFVVHLTVTITITVGELILAHLLSLKYKLSFLDLFLMVLIAILTTFFLSYIYYKSHNKNTPNYPPLDFNVNVLRHERIHRYNSETEYNHKRRYKLKSMVDGLTQFSDKFSWTGPDYKLCGGTEDYTVELDSNYNDLFNIYHFKFKKPLQKNEIIEVEAEWKLTGPGRSFFSVQIDEPPDLLIMKIIINPLLGIKKVNCKIGPNKASKQALESRRENLNSDGEYIWTKKPKLLYHYEINWEDKP